MTLIINNMGEFVEHEMPRTLKLKDGPASRRIDHERKAFANAHAKTRNVECAWCGEQFETRRTNQLYCSAKCKRERDSAAARERRRAK